MEWQSRRKRERYHYCSPARMKKILFVPPHLWYIETYIKYLIRYLSDEFFMESAYVPYPPFDNFISRFPDELPTMRNPEKYDLIVPIYPKRWGVPETKEWAKKIAQIWYEPNEGPMRDDVVAIAATTPIAEKSLEGFPHHSVRFGIDINHFSPFPMMREDNLLHVGMMGTLNNPRRMVKDILPYIKDIPGVRIIFTIREEIRTLKGLEEMGGPDALPFMTGSEKWWFSLPNAYNQLDVLLRTDSDPGFSFPVLEASACGVPCIATDQGIDHIFTKQVNGGLLIETPPGYNSTREWAMNHPDEVGKAVREAIIWMRDNPTKRKEMGIDARAEAVAHWQWSQVIPAWREFFRDAVSKL